MQYAWESEDLPHVMSGPFCGSFPLITSRPGRESCHLYTSPRCFSLYFNRCSLLPPIRPHSRRPRRRTSRQPQKRENSGWVRPAVSACWVVHWPVAMVEWFCLCVAGAISQEPDYLRRIDHGKKRDGLYQAEPAGHHGLGRFSTLSETVSCHSGT